MGREKEPKKVKSPHTPCPLRKVVSGENGYVIYCLAAGQEPLLSGWGEEDLLKEACGGCPIPGSLERKMKPCLYLVPLRIRMEKEFRTGFTCRWFYGLEEKGPPNEMWMLCGGCQHWFPRPPDEALVPDLEKWVERMIRIFFGPDSPLDREDSGR